MLKITLKQLLIPILASRPITAIASRLFGCGIPIFMLHRMADKDYSGRGRVTAEHLRRCLQYLVDNNYNFCSLERLIFGLKHKEAPPPKTVVFTMDDGFAEQAEIAAPIFLEYDCPLTFFVITGMLDQSLWPWDTQISWIIDSSEKSHLETNIAGKSLSVGISGIASRRLARRSIQDAIRQMDAELIPDILQQLARDAAVSIPENAPASYRPMNWEIARQLESQGVQFAPHSVNHNILSRLNKDSMEKEIRDSFQTLKKELKKPLKVFCYPRGVVTDFGAREIETLKSCNFLGAVTTTPDFVDTELTSQEQLFSLPRFALPDSMPDFIQYCTWIEHAKNSYRKSAISE